MAESKSIKETIDDGLRQFEIGDMKKAMALFEEAKSQIELEMKNSSDNKIINNQQYPLEYISVVINKLCIIYSDYLADFEKAMRMNDQIIKSLEHDKLNERYIAAIINKAMILDKNGKDNSAFKIYQDAKQLCEQANLKHSKLYVEALFGLPSTFSELTHPKQHFALWNECLEVAEKVCGKFSLMYLEILYECTRSEALEEIATPKFKELAKEFESKSELRNSIEFAYCLYYLARMSNLDEEIVLDSWDKFHEIYDKLYGKTTLLGLIAYRALINYDDNRAEHLFQLEKPMKELVGIKHPEYMALLSAIPKIMRKCDPTKFLLQLDKSIDFSNAKKQCKRLVDLKEAQILFKRKWWDGRKCNFKVWETDRTNFINSFQLYQRCIVLSLMNRGLYHHQTFLHIRACADFAITFSLAEKAIPLINLARKVAEVDLASNKVKYLELFELTHRLEMSNSRWNKCAENLKEWRTCAMKLVGEKSLSYALSVKCEAEMTNREGDETTAIELYHKAISLFKEAGEEDSYDYYNCYSELAEIAAANEDFDEALKFYDLASGYISRWVKISVTAKARDVMCLKCLKEVEESPQKTDEEKRNIYLRAFTGKYSAEHCAEYMPSMLEYPQAFVNLTIAHNNCMNKPLPFSTLQFTQGFPKLLKHIDHWDCTAAQMKSFKEMSVYVLHHLIAPEVDGITQSDLARICIVPLKTATDLLRIVRLLKSSNQIDSQLSDRKRVILNSVFHTIRTNSGIQNSSKYLDRIFNFGSNRKTLGKYRKTLGKSKSDFYVNTVAGCSDQLIQEYYSLLNDLLQLSITNRKSVFDLSYSSVTNALEKFSSKLVKTTQNQKKERTEQRAKRVPAITVEDFSSEEKKEETESESEDEPFDNGNENEIENEIENEEYPEEWENKNEDE